MRGTAVADSAETASHVGTGTTFVPPGPGSWELETTHHGLRPLSHLVRDAYVRAFQAGVQAMLARYGLPLAGIRAELVEGCMYVRPYAVGEGKKPSGFLTFVLTFARPACHGRTVRAVECGGGSTRGPAASTAATVRVVCRPLSWLPAPVGPNSAIPDGRARWSWRS